VPVCLTWQASTVGYVGQRGEPLNMPVMPAAPAPSAPTPSTESAMREVALPIIARPQ
jgi:hypothetical protein